MAKVYQNQPFNTNTKSYYLWQIYLFITAKLAGNQLSFITYIYINLFSLINSESKSIIVPTHVGVNRKSSLVLPFITKAKAYLKQIANLALISLGASQDKLELWLMNSQQKK